MNTAEIRHPAYASKRTRRRSKILAFRYPKLCNWLIFRRTADGRWDAFDVVQEKHFLLDSRTCHYIRRLNGKRNPFLISRAFGPDEVKLILRFLHENHLLRLSRRLDALPEKGNISVWFPSRITGKIRAVSYCLNLLLMLSFIPVFVIGLRLYLRSPIQTVGVNFWGCLFSFIVSTAFHEIGHAIACLAYGGYLFELGVNIRPLNCGGYVMMETQHIASRAKKAQICAAGIEAQLLFCGIFLALGAASPILTDFCVGAVVGALSGALFNGMILPDLDGSLIWCELTNADEPLDQLIGFFRDPETRLQTLYGGARRKLSFLIYCIALIASPVLYVTITARFMVLILC